MLHKKFDELKREAIKLLQQDDVAVDDVTYELSTVEDDYIPEHEAFLDDKSKKLEECSNHKALFRHLNLYWTYLSYHLLAHLVDMVTALESMRNKMESYEWNLKLFRVLTPLKLFCEVKPQHIEQPRGFSKVVAEFKKEIATVRDMTLQDLEEFRFKYAREHKLRDFAFMLDGVKPGCFIVTFLVPDSIVVKLQVNIPEDMLREFGITTLIVADKCVYSCTTCPQSTLAIADPDTMPMTTVTDSTLAMYDPVTMPLTTVSDSTLATSGPDSMPITTLATSGPDSMPITTVSDPMLATSGPDSMPVTIFSDSTLATSGPDSMPITTVSGPMLATYGPDSMPITTVFDSTLATSGPDSMPVTAFSDSTLATSGPDSMPITTVSGPMLATYGPDSMPVTAVFDSTLATSGPDSMPITTVALAISDLDSIPTVWKSVYHVTTDIEPPLTKYTPRTADTQLVQYYDQSILCGSAPSPTTPVSIPSYPGSPVSIPSHPGSPVSIPFYHDPLSPHKSTTSLSRTGSSPLLYGLFDSSTSSLYSEHHPTADLIKELEAGFNHLRQLTKLSMETHGISVSQIAAYVTTLPADTENEHTEFLKRLQTVLYKTVDHFELLGAMIFYWHYMCYGLLDHMVCTFNLDDVQNSLQAHKGEVQRFQEQTTLVAFCETEKMKRVCPPEFSELVTQFQWSDTVKLERVEAFRKDYVQHYHLQDYTMILAFAEHIRPSDAFRISWFLPASVIRTLRGSSPDALIDRYSITRLEIAEYPNSDLFIVCTAYIHAYLCIHILCRKMPRSSQKEFHLRLNQPTTPRLIL